MGQLKTSTTQKFFVFFRSVMRKTVSRLPMGHCTLKNKMSLQLIKIEDSENDCIAVTFEHLLKVISRRCSHLTWSVQFLDVLNLSGTASEEIAGYISPLGFQYISEIENAVSNSPKGLILNWEKLLSLTIFIDKLECVDLKIVGCSDIQNIRRYDYDDKLLSNHVLSDMSTYSDVVIEFYDSSYWQVFAKDINVIKALQSNFKSTQVFVLT